jgi:uncharacterized protein YutE (UPF0331/DUF86 family)
VPEVDRDRLREKIGFVRKTVRHLPRANAPAFKAMVKFRNRAVHLYDEISPEEVYRILEHDLGDFELFLEAIVRRYF